MATKKKPQTLVSPDGKREWTPESPSQATDLKARGWAPKPAEKPKPKPAPKPASKSD